VVDLHLEVKPLPAYCVLARVVELYVLCIPFDRLSHLVVRRLCREHLSEIAVHSVSEVGLSVYLGEDSRLVGREEGEAHALLGGIVPVPAAHIEVNGGLLHARVVAICEVPVRAVEVVVPIGVPVGDSVRVVNEIVCFQGRNKSA